MRVVQQELGVVGEETIIKAVYLSTVTRLFPKPVSLTVKGPSSSGKSYTSQQILKLAPPSAFHQLTAASPKALIHSPVDFRHRLLVVLEATPLQRDEHGEFAHLLRTLQSEGRISYDTVIQDKDGNMAGTQIVKPGPTGLILTTTADTLHAENETRALSL